jgi:hypothetical protein
MAQHKVDIYMPLYVRDFLTSTLGWSAEERGHYLTLAALVIGTVPLRRGWAELSTCKDAPNAHP